MKQRFIRIDDELTDDVAVVVRGGDLDPEILRHDALRNHEIYGTFGLPVFADRDLTVDEPAQQAPLVRVRAAGHRHRGRAAGTRAPSRPTGRNPRHYDVTFDDVDEGTAKLARCEHYIMGAPVP